MKNKIKHIFFDLDRTLWDFDKNSKEVISDLFIAFEIDKKCEIPFELFYKTYQTVNDELWTLYRLNKISKEYLRSSRFTKTMELFGYNDSDLGMKMELDYISHSPLKKKLLPGTVELLTQLKENYYLHIITNGFKEVQRIKITNSGIAHFFTHVLISEEVGANKPDKAIFLHALKVSGALGEESIMVGDDLEIDIKGAEAVGMNGIYFNENGKSEMSHKNEISKLDDLLKFL